MAEIIHFMPKHAREATLNLAEFIRVSREELTVFGRDLNWNDNHWPAAGISFGNMDNKTRKLNTQHVMQEPFLSVAKAYVRYQQGHRPTKNKTERLALKCLERALIERNGCADIQQLNTAVLDQAVMLAKASFSKGVAYQAAREIERLANFVSEKRLIPNHLDWKSPIKRPVDTVRTGEKARQNREKKLPNEEVLEALADIFASNPTEPKDIFTSCVCAMLLCAPSRISEILALPVDCEVWQDKKNGEKAYGWRFQPAKGGVPCIKWIPDPMVTLAQEAIGRIRKLTSEARNIAAWFEQHPDRFYRHQDCPDVLEDAPLNVVQASMALGIPTDTEKYARHELHRFGLSVEEGGNTLALLNPWVQRKQPKAFPWYDKARSIRYSEALFCFQARQLRTDMPASPIILWKPSANTLNDDLSSRETSPDYFAPGIFDRQGINTSRTTPLKANSHQFRHLLNTMAQRGGLSQSEIARWSGRADMKQNRAYDHMSEFELVDMLRSHDSALSLDRPLEEIAEQIASKIPMTRQEFNSLAIPTAHVTEYGFCIHNFTMSPCQKFRDCLNCTEQVCIKGDKRLVKLKERLSTIQILKEKAEQEMKEGTAGADRWYQVQDLTEKRLIELIAIMEDPHVKPGAIIKLRNENEFDPMRRALESKKEKKQIDSMKNLLGGGLG